MINKKRLVNSFKKLVQIDSLSLNEGKVIKHLQKELKALGLKPYLAGKPEEGEVGNLIVDVPGRGLKKPRIILSAHVDTVTPGEKIKPIQRKGYILTNGKTILGADDKAGVAVILELLKVLKKNKLPHPPLRVIFTVAEEAGLVGSSALPKKFIGGDFGIVLDGGDIEEIINQAPTQYNITVTIFGKAAHAGIHPKKGINAIKVAAVAIAKMKLGRIDSETTANIGIIKGGKATNIIPEMVWMKGEVRSHSLPKVKKQVSHMKQVIIEACRKYKARAKIDVRKVYVAFNLPKTQKVMKLALLIHKKMGIRSKLVKSGGGSDANIFNAAGVPTINMAVGMDRIHTTKERLKIKDLIKGAQVVLSLLTKVD
ncbi:MAG: M20/M25/M40 family metallo-hydrolase [Candidatus Saganbacteria bacterium]|nr:M20/M25/M40 family metallo-hydrolase [Candidatus Saganbacteria bacterium]